MFARLFIKNKQQEDKQQEDKQQEDQQRAVQQRAVQQREDAQKKIEIYKQIIAEKEKFIQDQNELREKAIKSMKQQNELREKATNSFDLEDFYNKIIAVVVKDDKDVKDVIYVNNNYIDYKLITSYTLIEDTSFNENLKRCLIYLHKYDADDNTLSTLNLGKFKQYNYITINEGNDYVSGIEYEIKDNLLELKLEDDNTLSIIPLLFGIIRAFHINNKDKNEGEKFYTITLTNKEQEAQGEQGAPVAQGGKNKKNKKGAKQNIKPTKPIKPVKPTITGKKEILGKERCIYKKAGDRKEYVKYKGDLITVKDYKKIISVKKTKK